MLFANADVLLLHHALAAEVVLVQIGIVNCMKFIDESFKAQCFFCKITFTV